jgi:uncharacterized membrane protein
MARDRTIRIVTIAVWVVAAVVVVGLAFVKSNTPTVGNLRVAGGALPVVYEFSTDS